MSSVMMEQCAWLETILKQNQIGKTISQVVDFKVDELVSDGDFYSSYISTISLDVILTCGKKSKITLIEKKSKAYKDGSTVEGFPAIKREILVHHNILRIFEKLMNEHHDYNDKLWGDLIGYKPYSLMILENLKAQNFKVANRKVLLDKNHTLLVVNSLGRFHALGHVIIKKGLLTKNDFEQHYIEVDSPMIKNIFQNGFKQISEEIQTQWGTEWKEIAVRLGKQHTVLLQKLKELLVLQEDSFLTVCHGDCWTCNLMFKYCPYDETKPIAVRFLDFQTVHINSYVFDVIHFLHVCVHPEVRRTYFEQILTVYHNSLKSTLSLYGMEDSAPTMEHLNAEVARIEYYAFALNMLILPLTISELNNAFSTDNIFQEWNESKVFKSEIYSTELCKEFLGNDIKYWLKREMF